MQDGGTTRKYIKIEPGTYAAEVLIPQTTVPLTLYGTVGNPEDVRIVLTQPATMTGTEYANQVNPGGTVYQNGDPAWSMYNGCASKETIGKIWKPRNDKVVIKSVFRRNLLYFGILGQKRRPSSSVLDN